MTSNGSLGSRSNSTTREEMWSETWRRIYRFAPNLKEDLAFDDRPQSPTEATRAEMLKKSSLNEVSVPLEEKE